jgi:hypothetical protein
VNEREGNHGDRRKAIAVFLHRVAGLGDPTSERIAIDAQKFFARAHKVLDLIVTVVYIPRRCARRKKTSQLVGAERQGRFVCDERWLFERGFAGRCGCKMRCRPRMRTQRFSIGKMSSAVAGGDAQAFSQAAA